MAKKHKKVQIKLDEALKWPAASDIDTLMALDKIFRREVTYFHYTEEVEDLFYGVDDNGVLVQLKTDEEVLDILRDEAKEDIQKKFDKRMGRLKEKYKSGIPEDILTRELASKHWAELEMKDCNEKIEQREYSNSWRCVRDRLIELGEEKGKKFPTSRASIFAYRKRFIEKYGAVFRDDDIFRYAEDAPEMRQLWDYLEPYMIDGGNQLLQMIEGHKNSAIYGWLRCFLTGLVHYDTMLDSLQVSEMQQQTNYELLPELMTKICEKQPIMFFIRGWSKDRTRHKVRFIKMHPYLLKSYNSRWYLIGAVQDKDADDKHARYKDLGIYMVSSIIQNPRVSGDEYDGIKGLPVETIRDWIEDGSRMDFVPFDVHMGKECNLVDYFANAIGVHINSTQEPIDIVLRFDPVRFEYVRSKPLTRNMIEVTPDLEEFGQYYDPDYSTVVLHTHDSNELLQQVLSFGPHCEVIAPDYLRDKFKEKVRDMYKMYKLDEESNPSADAEEH